MAAANVGRRTVAMAVGRGERTITGWTSGDHMPDEAQRVILRRLFPGYDTPGDPVEVALEQSELVDWRRDAVRSTYRRHISDQREGRSDVG